MRAVWADRAGDHGEVVTDDRITCSSCRNRPGSTCIAWKELDAIRGYSPDPEMRRRCEAYVPSGGEDLRTGRERWPNLRAWYPKEERKR